MLHPSDRRPISSRGFTLVELLVVIGIIVVLISILIPVVGKVRRAAQVSVTTSFMNQLAQAIEQYAGDHKAYPGPFANTEICNKLGPTGGQLPQPPFNSFVVAPTAGPAGFTTSTPTALAQNITSSENMVLGIFGGLTVNPLNAGELFYDPALVGNGATSLNVGGVKTHSKPYMEVKYLSWRDETGKKTGQFADDGGKADDTIIPELVDNFTDPLPILYLRARKGAKALAPPSSVVAFGRLNNTVVTYDPAEAVGTPSRLGQYDLHQIIGYTGANPAIGAGRKLNAPSKGWNPTDTAANLHGLRTVDHLATSSSKYPYDAYPYFRNAALSTPSETDSSYTTTTFGRNDVPHQKDSFIIISAGADRVYGTSDDITNFGSVK